MLNNKNIHCNWWNKLTPKYRSRLCKKYLGFETYTPIFNEFILYSEYLITNYHIKQIYDKHFLKL